MSQSVQPRQKKRRNPPKHNAAPCERKNETGVSLRGVWLQAAPVQRAAVIVPICTESPQKALAQAEKLRTFSSADIVELRLDALRVDGALPAPEALAVCLDGVRRALGQKPLLATMRTTAEGGQAELSPKKYVSLLKTLLEAKHQPPLLDALDIEWRTAGNAFSALCAQAAQAGVVAVGSSHEFSQTPPCRTMTARLCAMREGGAAVCKLAVMPTTQADAARLLKATAQASARMPGVPLITMSMGSLGAVTRVCGAAFGSAATFGTLGAASAPGQPKATVLHAALEAVQRCQC